MSDWEYEYDKMLANPPEPKESRFKCDKCGRPFQTDDRVYECDCDNLCEECAYDWLNDLWHYATWEQCYGD